MRASTRLRRLFEAGGSVVAPGVFDGLSARLVEQAGFEAIYASGGAIARSGGVPDMGLLSLDAIVARLAGIVDATGLPVIADADTGYGNALNTQMAVRAFERAGVAALHLEDQTFPKRCGHYDDKALVPVREMTQKLKAAKEAITDPDLVLIARTDALAVEGLEAAIGRAQAYRDAGADMLFVEAPTSVAQIEEIARRLPGWKLINMFEGGKTPLVPAARLAEMGYALVIVPSDLQRAAIAAMREALGCLKADGSTAAMVGRMASFKEREQVVGTAAWLAKERRFAS